MCKMGKSEIPKEGVAAVRPRRLLDWLRYVLVNLHKRAVEKRPLLHFIAFSIIALIFAYLVFHIGVVKNQPLAALIPVAFAGFSARDAWGSYKVWRRKR